MEQAQQLERQEVKYQISRKTLVRILWKRAMLRPGQLVFLALLGAGFITCTFLRGAMEYVGIVFLGVLVIWPPALYLGFAKAIANNSYLTDFKTLEFGPSYILVSGTDWKTQVPWTQFKGFSEDNAYFYLHLADNGLASVVPKNVFSLEQQEVFRRYAKTGKLA